MDVPEAVRAELGGDEVVASVDLGGDDALFVAPERTLIYRSEGLLSDESVETYPHDAERVSVSESRRKASITLDYGLDGERSFKIARSTLSDVLLPVLAGVLAAGGVIDTGETVERVFRFSELTLVVTSRRVVKHVGAAVWDEEYEAFHYDDVTDLTVEEGEMATSVVLTLGDRQERFKAPTDRARELRETLTDAVTAHHGVSSVDALRSETESKPEPDAGDDEAAFGDGPDPLSAQPADGNRTVDTTLADDGMSPTADTTSETGVDQTAEPMTADAAASTGDGREAQGDEAEADEFAGGEFEPAAPKDDIHQELAELRTAVDEQRKELERQSDLIEQLIEELRRGR